MSSQVGSECLPIALAPLDTGPKGSSPNFAFPAGSLHLAECLPNRPPGSLPGRHTDRQTDRQTGAWDPIQHTWGIWMGWDGIQYP